MEDFFAGNNYDIVDKKTFKPNEITFDNIWGVCDEVLCKLKTHRTFSTFWFSSRTSQRYKNQKELNFSHAEMTMFKTLFLYLTKIVKLCWIL